MKLLTARALRASERLVVAALVAAVVAAPLGGAASAGAACGIERGNWTTIPAPSFPAGEQAVRHLAVDPRDPGNMFASNAAAIVRSSDGGCSWASAFEPAEGGPSVEDPLGGGDQTIVALEVSERGARAGLLAGVAQAAGPATRPRVLRSTDGGRTWEPGDAGLPPTGSPSLLRIAPSDPSVAYVGISFGGAVQLLFGSNDGGLTWDARSNFGQSLGTTVIDLQIDPLDPSSLWVGSGDGLYHSTDGGRTFEAVDQFTGEPAGPIDVFHARGEPANLVAFYGARPGGKVSVDGGRNWLDIQAPQQPITVAHGNLAQQRIASGGGSVWAFAPSILSWINLRPPSSGITGITADRLAQPGFYGHTARTIEVYRGPVGIDVRVPPDEYVIPDQAILPPGVLPPQRPASLSPRRTVVRIAPGASKEVPFRLALPEERTPLDVYFLVDTSSSMGPFLRQLASEIADITNALVRSRVDVRFGFAEYRDYPNRPVPTEDEPTFVYKQDLDISPPGPALEEVIESIRPDGGGYYNAQLAALLQTATGEGEEVWPPGPANDVPPNQDADYRAKALHVAVLVSDSDFVEEVAPAQQNDPTAPQDLPQFEEVAAALRARDIHQVGISLRDGGVAKGTADMNAMAEATGALAPGEGVDCDGNGTVDLVPGAPLVCELSKEGLEGSGSLAPAMVNLVEAIRTRESVALVTRGPARVVERVTPESYEDVILQKSDSVGFEVTFTCPKADAGERFDIEIRPRGLAVTEPARAVVVCTEEQEEDVLPLLLKGLLPLAPLMPPAPPPPPTELVSSTQAQAQSQAQAQANAAMAAQEQENPQVAMVHAFHAAQREAMAEEYQMSALRRDEPAVPHAAMLGAVALLSSVAFTFLRRTGRAPAYSRRRT